jgi:hypothetical protein
MFFAAAAEWEESAFISAWDRVPGEPGFWRFVIVDDLVRVPVRNLGATAIAFIGNQTAQIVCPSQLFV